jgi:hypothetical protein
MIKIKIFCDDAGVWENLSQIFETSKTRTLEGEPYLEFNYKNVRFESFIYGCGNTNELPKKIINFCKLGCRPDIWFYNPQNDNIVLAIEETLTAPVGNAQKQRIPRPMLSIEHGFPFIYVCPQQGFDNSQKTKRNITGPFLELKNKNPKSFLDLKEYDLKKIIDKVVEYDCEQYIMKSPFNLKERGKNRPTFKKSNSSFIENLRMVIHNDTSVYNVIEKKGNIFFVPMGSKVSKFLQLSEDSIIIIGASHKPNGTFSDPFAGSIYMTHLIKKWCRSDLKIFVTSSSNPKNLEINTLLQSNNKLTFSLSLCDGFFDSDGNNYKVNCEIDFSPKYKGDDESVATYIRVQNLTKEGKKVNYVNYPHGSWSSKNGKNDTKRDQKRGDIYYEGSKNGEEGKKYLSEIVKHIEKYGLIHDFYYYLYEDIQIPMELKNKMIHVSFL